ncbi:guanine nucleotide-binding protein subunit gamma-1-like [Penaeus vannamei]|uniref:guanine nucleotide-binding protein subunit gamma-1-like n=1 Tax=Penaeus vannamei TaxID=6689 RepID=UPI00387F537F
MCLNGIVKGEAQTNLQVQSSIVEQLRREASIKRTPVSEAVEDIKQFILQHEQEDYLLIGFSSQKNNPFREKSSCDIL